MTTRRNLLSLGLTGAALTLSPALVTAALAQARAIGAIRVDTSRIARQGWGENAERIRIALEALCLSAHGVPLKRIQHFLDARPLWSVLANAVHQVLPHRHDLRAAASRLR